MCRFFTHFLRNHYFEYSWYNLELLRLLGSVTYGGCDAAKFLETVTLLEANDAVSWQRCWVTVAERTHGLARETMQCGHMVRRTARTWEPVVTFDVHSISSPSCRNQNQLHLLHLNQRYISCFERAGTLISHEMCRIKIPHGLKKAERSIQWDEPKTLSVN